MPDDTKARNRIAIWTAALADLGKVGHLTAQDQANKRRYEQELKKAKAALEDIDADEEAELD